jgi:hypothetical protein
MRGCRSVVITHSNLELCREFWYHLLESSGDHQNWVEAGPDFKNVVIVVQNLERNPKKAQEIAENGYSLFHHFLSENALDCYIQEFFHLYSLVMYWSPKLEENDASLETYFLYPYNGNYPQGRLQDFQNYPQLFI